ncbi:MAG: SCO family protein [Rhodospirillaceae bacterium]|nr:SCO family protein [Rhodospirillaceae bacterium]
MSSRMNYGRLALIALAAFGAALAVVALWSKPAPQTEQSAQSLIGGPFELTDAAGTRRRDAEFRGRYMLVFFGFTNCPDFCPTALSGITEAMAKLGDKAKNVVPIFITVDPERDTPAVLKNYAQNFDSRIVMLTGTPAEIAAVARAYRVYYAKRKLEKEGEYTMDHSAYMYLMGPDGKFIAHFRHAVPPAELAKTLAERFERRG